MREKSSYLSIHAGSQKFRGFSPKLVISAPYGLLRPSHTSGKEALKLEKNKKMAVNKESKNVTVRL